MTQIKYSVIIPVYNAERTLKRCLDSLLGQNREDVEIILINDGSSDGSRAVLENYGSRFPNVRAVHQENAGVSAARNRGLDEAEGKYITFVDSDDYVSEDYFRAMDEAGEREDSDLIVFAKDIAGQGIDERDLYQKLCAADTLDKKRQELLRSRIIIEPSFKRFKRKLIEKQKLRFLKDMYVGEDFNFCFAYMLACRSIAVFYKKIYIFDVSDLGSLSRKCRSDLVKQLRWEIKEAVSSVRDSSLTAEEKENLLAILDYFMARNVFSCIAETFKTGKPSYWKNRNKYRNICLAFKGRVSSHGQYCGKNTFTSQKITGTGQDVYFVFCYKNGKRESF